MSLTDFRTAKRQDQESAREQDREDRRLAAQLNAQAREQERLDEAARREQDRLDAARAAQEKKDREDAERAAKAQQDRERARERARRRKERRDLVRRRLAAVPKWLAEHLDLSSALVVMLCSIVPALISQASTLRRTGLVEEMGFAGWVLVALLPVMLEIAAWAATAGETKALRQRRSPWPYRIAVYVFVGLAAAVNFWHGAQTGGERWGTALGAVLAASSVFPVVLFQLVQLGRHVEYRDERRAQRLRRREARATRKLRRSKLRAVWDAAVRLRAVAGHERLSEEDAWQVAYAVFEGAGSEALSDEVVALLSAELLGTLVEAEGRRAVVLEELAEVRLGRRKLSEVLSVKECGEGLEERPVEPAAASGAASVVLPARFFEASSTELVVHPGTPRLRMESEQINTSVPASARASESAPAPTRDTALPRTRRAKAAGGARKLSPGARKAAAVTAKAYSASENAELEEWIRGQLAAGKKAGAQEVADETARRRKERLTKKRAAELGRPGKTWCYDRIAAAKRASGKPVRGA
ncbi:hypothetical protein ABT390_34025 [Streptomyces aurantiacus]|uniref:DUF2637 domain-containing protein n=1 Tax=Streptomyces aurantiacus JA 4570 TaxID=1286094 RepID=S4AZT6_9ACTN|nr:hypothetical protein [Streptomyces aurantiacus]EPH46862.1 hypothetical protein STRAU_0028 [Streptomyces aurantiacus JA 4570]